MVKSGLKLLIVEDSPTDAELLIESLKSSRRFKYQITHAKKLSEAKTFATADSFDAVLLDLNLPDSKSDQTIEAIKSTFHDLPVLVLTGLYDEELAVMAVSKGAQDFIAKGVAVEALELAIRYAIQRNSMEKRLRTSREEMAEIITKSPVIMVITDKDAKVEMTNPAAIGITGGDTYQGIGKRAGELIKCINRKESDKGCGYGDSCKDCPVRKAIKETYETGKSVYKAEARYVLDKDVENELHVFNISTSAITFGGSKKVLLSIDDITDSALAQQHIVEEKEKAQQYLDVAAVMMLAIDQQGNISMINKKGCEVLGYKDEKDVLGLNWFDNFIPEDVRSNVKRIFADTIKMNISEQSYYENAIMDKWGVKKIIAWNNSVITNGDGVVHGTLSSGNDITERVKAKNELEKSREQYRIVVENQNDLIMRVDSEYNVRYVNPVAEKILGKTQTEMMKVGFMDFIHEEDREAAIEDLNSITIDKPSSYHEERVHTTEGLKWIGWSLKGEFDDKGGLVGIVGVGRDVTDRVVAEISMKNAIRDSKRKSLEVSEMLKGTRSVIENADDFEKTAKIVFDSCKKLTGAKSGYVALLNDNGDENEVLFLDAGGMPCSVDPDLPMPVRGLRAEAYKDNKVVFNNDFMNSEHVKFMPKGHVILKNVMFAPLVVKGRTVGIIGLANKDGDFTGNDARIAGQMGEIGALAYSHSKSRLELMESEARFRSLIQNIPGVFYRCEYDNDWTMIFLSRNIEKLSGYRSEELINNKVASYASIIHPDDVKYVENIAKEGVDKKKPFELEYRIIHKNGDVRWVSEKGSAIYDENGRVKYLDGVIFDITGVKKAEIELKESEKRFKTIFNTAANLITSVDKDGVITDCNERVEQVWGYRKEEVIGKPMGFVIHPDYHEKAGESLKTIMKQGTLYDRYYKFVKKDGSVIDIKIDAAALYDENGEFLRTICTLNDVTRRLQDEKDIKYQAQMLESVSDAIIGTDNDFNIVSWNKGAEKIYGYTADEVKGKNVAELLKNEYIDYNREEVIMTFKKYGSWQGEIYQTRKDGERRHLMTSVNSVIDSECLHIGNVCNARDVTELKEAERLIIESEDKYRSIFDNSQDGIVILSGNVIIDANEASKVMFGLVGDRMVGRTFFELSPELQPDGKRSSDEGSEIIRKIEKEQALFFNWQNKRTDGTLFFTECMMAPFVVENRKLILAIMRDVTERIESQNKLETAYESLKEVDKLKSNFISIISHELRTPVTVIKGFNSFLMKGVGGKLTDAQKEYMNIISSNTERLAVLINDLIDMSRIESGSFSVEKEYVDLVTVIKNCVVDISNIAAEKKITVEGDIEFEKLFVKIDMNRFYQTVINLLNNAVKFTNIKGHINVILKRGSIKSVPDYLKAQYDEKRKYFKICVKDDGVGVESKEASRIFERFYQVESPDNRKHQGLGLGLSIAKNIVDAHDGFIWAESDGLGKGTLICMMVPYYSEGRMCEKLQSCGILDELTMDEDLNRMVGKYCEGDFEKCSRYIAGTKGDIPEKDLLPDGTILKR